MIIEVALMPLLNVLDPTAKNVNITMSSSIRKEDVEIARTSITSTFSMGDIDRVIKFIGNDADPLIAYLMSIWSK